MRDPVVNIVLVGVIFCILFIIQENFVIADRNAGLEKLKRPVVGYCGDEKSDPLDTKTRWKDACYDVDGNSYKVGDFLMSCCGCFKFICSNKTEKSVEDPNCTDKYGWDKVLEDTCCEDCHGDVFPAGSVIKEQIMEDKCATTVTTKCVFINGKNKATIEESLSYEKCCTNSSGVYPVNTTSMLVPKECSVRTCSRPWGRHEASWTLTKKAEGYDCCVYQGKLYPDKAWVIIKGQNATCCEGKWLVSIEEEEEIITTIGLKLLNGGETSRTQCVTLHWKTPNIKLTDISTLINKLSEQWPTLNSSLSTAESFQTFEFLV